MALASLTLALASAHAGAIVDGSGSPSRSSLTLDERVEAQRAIERVRWTHRIWPETNTGPRPAFESVLPEPALRTKVEDYLKKTNALEAYWDLEVTPEHLQAELDRIARSSRAPDMLQEMFSSLGNDPLVIAETLARQSLVDRLIRSRYARDDRFHGALRRLIETTLADVANLSDLRSPDAVFSETTWIARGARESAAAGAKSGVFVLDDDAWRAERDRWKSLLGSEASSNAGAQPRVTALQEDETSFWVASVRDIETAEFRTVTASWSKTGFDAWWSETRASMGVELTVGRGDFLLPALSGSASCDPETWTRTSGPPAPRSDHTAVWTGSEMIVWGGDIVGHPATGGRYDPVMDVWVPTSTVGAPSDRSHHTAVWTGTEMIVWGGISDAFQTDTGGRYDPVNDTWNATALTGAPTSAAGHTAIWSGTEMIVWGDATGGRYDPVSDAWLPMSTVGAPVLDRRDHTAVWTGTEMIVWGGQFGGQLDTGGRYNPATDSWAATSLVNAPTPRTEHTAVWVGTEMIVWGGGRGRWCACERVSRHGRTLRPGDGFVGRNIHDRST